MNTNISPLGDPTPPTFEPSPAPPRKWWTKKRFIIPAGVILGLSIIGALTTPDDTVDTITTTTIETPATTTPTPVLTETEIAATLVRNQATAYGVPAMNKFDDETLDELGQGICGLVDVADGNIDDFYELLDTTYIAADISDTWTEEHFGQVAGVLSAVHCPDTADKLLNP